MKVNKLLTASTCSLGLLFSGSAAAYADTGTSTYNSPLATHEQTPLTQTVVSNGHTYTVKYDESTRLFTSYLDGNLVTEISYADLQAEIEKAQKSASEERVNGCAVGMATVSTINGLLWLGAGIATGGAAVPIAGFVTGLIPTVGGLFC